MALKTKCIKNPIEITDGLRISVMSRHTLNDGVTLDGDITNQSFDQWWKELAPPTDLIGDYYKRELPWETFEQRFAVHLASFPVQGILQKLVRISRGSNVTILCVEPTPEKCHRRLIAEACQRVDPAIETIIQ